MPRNGREFDFGDRKVTFYPLTLRQIQNLEGEIANMQAMTGKIDPKQLGAILKVITASAQRGDPSMTEDVLADLIDTSNVQEVTQSVFAVSGFKESKPGEANPPSTGGSSTPQ